MKSALEESLQYLTAHEQRLVSNLSDPFCPWVPSPGPQTTAIITEAFETLYGGAAGGGKSDFLLGLARLDHRRSLILRRTYPDLERSLIQRSLEFYGEPEHYNGSKHYWKFDDQVIQFGNMERATDYLQYQSAQYDMIGFDELTQFIQEQYEYMISRARTAKKNQRVRIVACTNPGGEGEAWVIERWAPWLSPNVHNKAKPGELRWYLRNAEGVEEEVPAGTKHALSRTFIRARLGDNPYLSASDDYSDRLNALPEPFRSQLRDGDWTAGSKDNAYQVIPAAWIHIAVERWKKWDAEGRKIKKWNGVGVDCSRGGADKTYFAPYGDQVITEIELFDEGGDTMRTVGHCILVNDRIGGEIVVDVLNMGGGIVDRLAEQKKSITAFDAGGKAKGKDKSGYLKFLNKRAEAWWNLREMLDPESGVGLALPPSDKLFGDLVAPRWQATSSGHVKIESKEEIKKRIKRSTDAGDAVMMVCFEVSPAYLLLTDIVLAGNTRESFRRGY